MTIDDAVVHTEIEYDKEMELKEEQLQEQCSDEIEESVNDLIDDIITKYDSMGMNVRKFITNVIDVPLDRVYDRWTGCISGRTV